MDTRVSVGVSAFTSIGGAVNPGETFSFHVEVRNAYPGGVALNNVKYRIEVVNPAIAKIQVPAGGTSISLTFPFPIVTPPMVVNGFIFTPTGENSSLGVGDIDTLPLTGKAGPEPGGGTTAINARILADIDLDKLFPKGENSTPGTNNLTVVG